LSRERSVVRSRAADRARIDKECIVQYARERGPRTRLRAPGEREREVTGRSLDSWWWLV
jgi:hypothetical protein